MTSAGEQATVPRGYHSTALLQPDGSVWTAGSTHTGADLTNPDSATRETRIEVYQPAYGGNRPQIEQAPWSITFDEIFSIEMANGDAMHRVVLIRCGSFTHAFDADQRYLTLPFQQAGTTLGVRAPASPNLAPPGNYLLFVLRNEETPCQQARFIRLAEQEAFAVLQLSTYSQLSVKALRPPYSQTDEARFSEAIDFIYQGFLPHELDIPAQDPAVTWVFSGGGNVPGMRIELNRRENEVDPAANPDVAQRYRFIFDVVFDNEDAFSTFDDDESRNVDVQARLNGRTTSVVLTLMKRANPFMKDGDPAWLSTDLRIHKARVGDVDAAGGPQDYIQGVLDAYENSPIDDETDAHPFDQLDDSQQENPVVLAVPEDDDGIYNFAIARVRFLSIPGEDASGVRVFFRLFNTVGTALEYNTSGTYRTLEGAGGPVPGPGRQVFAITSIPFFAAPRVTPDQSMTEQDDNLVNRRTLFGVGPAMSFRYFGCWLDVNTRDRHFPRFPQDDGPFGEGGVFEDLVEGGPPAEMIQLVSGYHQCLVAEIRYDDDPVQPGQTPFTSDNLAQRNLATVWVSNPGLDEITRTAQTSIDVKPSDVPTALLLGDGRIPSSTAATRRLRADELVFSRNNLPVGSKVELYLPDVDIDEVIALSALRNGPPALARVDAHTLRFELGEASYVALPGGRALNIAGLVSVTLPLGIVAGERYRLTVKQYSGRTLRWVGAFELSIPVGKGPDLLPAEVEKLSILKYIFTAMPKRDRWFPVFVRYLHEIGERVRGFGGDPDTVGPSAHGTGQARAPDCPAHHEESPMGSTCGKICEVEYDCFGDFEAFVVIDCSGKPMRICAGKDVERVVLMAWRERTSVTARYRLDDARDACVNATCPWSGKPVSKDAMTVFEGHAVGFCSTAHRDRFAKAVAAAAPPAARAPAVEPLNTECPFSGHKVQRDAVVQLPAGPLAFCSRKHAEKFRHALDYFREVARYVGTDTGVRPVQSEAGHGAHGEAEGGGGDDAHGIEHGDGHAHDHGQAASQQPPERPPSINRVCPWTGKPVSAGALTLFESHLVGFHLSEDRDRFARALALGERKPTAGTVGHDQHPSPSSAGQACPWSGKPALMAHAVSLGGGTVAFCSDAHRADFQKAVDHLRTAIKERPACCGTLVRLVLHC